MQADDVSSLPTLSEFVSGGPSTRQLRRLEAEAGISAPPDRRFSGPAEVDARIARLAADKLSRTRARNLRSRRTFLGNIGGRVERPELQTLGG